MARKKSDVQISDTHFASFLAAKEALDKKIKGEGLKAVKAFFAEYFEKRPDIYSVSWTQYTPYFNDGEPCYFRLGSVHAVPQSEASEVDVDDEYEFEVYDEEPQITLETIEDLLETIFGDHAKVTVTRDEITTEKYDHE